MKTSSLWLMLIGGLLMSACAAQTPQQPATLTVMTHDSFEVSQQVLDAFQEQQDVQVQILKAGDAGTMLNKAILARENPLADVLYGVDNTFLSRALQEDIFDPYRSPLLDEIPEAFQLDPQERALPVDYGDVCLNYDRGYFEEQGIDPPSSLSDLLGPRLRALTVVENPATSSPGLAFLLATIGRFGEDGYLDYWRGLLANDVRIVSDWSTAYYSEFTLHGGERPIVLSYGSSPPAEVYFAEEPLDEPPSGVVTGDRSCFRQIEFVGILRGTERRRLAEAWVDFMLSKTFQEDMPLNMFVFPVNGEAQLPPVFSEFLVIPEETSQVSPERIAAMRETWLQTWTEEILR